jgi:putative ABC transport system substrate-binding protein
LLRAGLALTSLALLSACGVPLPGAQQAAKVHRIGYLSTQSQAVDSPHFEAFRLGLRDLGYVEGETIALEYRYADGDLERLSDLVAELVRLNVDVIVTGGAPGSRAARQATSTIPLVMTVVGDPIQAGLVASLAKPGGNITGLTQVSPQLSGKRLELLQEALPRISLLAVLVDGGLLAQDISAPLQETKVAAGALGIKLHALEVGGPNLDLDGAFRTATSQGAGALIVLPGPVLELHRERIVDLAAKSGLPAIYSRSEYVEAGGLMAYGPDFIDLYRRAATYVDKILKGRQPADLPVEQPTKFELVINLKTAEQMGLTIPPSVLARADRVIR